MDFWTTKNKEYLKLDSAYNLLELQKGQLCTNRQLGLSTNYIHQLNSVGKLMFVSEVNKLIDIYTDNIVIEKISDKSIESNNKKINVTLKVKEG